jgi:putative DNA primase/helicase
VVADLPCTDLGNARRFVHQHGEYLRYVPPARSWLVWAADRWVQDDDGEVQRLAKHTAASIAEEAMRAAGPRREDLQRWWLQSESRHRLSNMIELATTEPGIPLPVEALDADPWVLAVPHGTLELRSGGLRPAYPEDYLTLHAGTVYDPQAVPVRWLRFLLRVFDGNRDLIRYVQRAVGYALTGSTREQKLFVLWGTGANGKSTFIETIRKVLGEYAKQTPAATFTHDWASDRVRNDLARLRAARFVSAVEVEQGKRLAESLVKQATGGDTVTARYLYREFFEYTPQFKVFIATNHKPIIKGTDHAIWRRIHLIPFTVRIPEHEQDPNLGTTLENELPGILNWALDGCLAWQREGLNPPREVVEATARYREEQDVLGDFLREHVVESPNATTPHKDLYKCYEGWAEESGIEKRHRMSSKAFSTALSERGIEQGPRRRAGPVWRGLLLLNSAGGGVEEPTLAEEAAAVPF